MGIVVQVERALLRQGAARLVAAGEQGPAPDGCVAAGPIGVAIVRCVPVTETDAPSRPRRRRVAITCGLAMCADVLIEAGFRVVRAKDDHGPYLRVGH